MVSVRVRAEQSTVDWESGAVFEVERTRFVDTLIADGGLVVVSDPVAAEPPEPVSVGPNDVDGEVPVVGEPPRSGKGSGLDAWQEFLTAHQIPYSPDDSRDDLITAWDTHTAAGE